MFANTILGFCIWDIPALIVFIVIVGLFIGHQVQHKNRQKDFEEQYKGQEAQIEGSTPTK